MDENTVNNSVENNNLDRKSYERASSNAVKPVPHEETELKDNFPEAEAADKVTAGTQKETSTEAPVEQSTVEAERIYKRRQKPPGGYNLL